MTKILFALLRQFSHFGWNRLFLLANLRPLVAVENVGFCRLCPILLDEHSLHNILNLLYCGRLGLKFLLEHFDDLIAKVLGNFRTEFTCGLPSFENRIRNFALVKWHNGFIPLDDLSKNLHFRWRCAIHVLFLSV